MSVRGHMVFVKCLYSQLYILRSKFSMKFGFVSNLGFYSFSQKKVILGFSKKINRKVYFIRMHDTDACQEKMCSQLEEHRYSKKEQMCFIIPIYFYKGFYSFILFKETFVSFNPCQDFPGGPMVTTCLPVQGVQV